MPKCPSFIQSCFYIYLHAIKLNMHATPACPQFLYRQHLAKFFVYVTKINMHHSIRMHIEVRLESLLGTHKYLYFVTNFERKSSNVLGWR